MPGVLVAEAARPVGGVQPEAVWDAVATHVGAAAFGPIELEAAASDYYRPGMAQAVAVEAANELAAGAQEVAEREPTIYTLGGIAVEAAGIIRADQLPGEQETRLRYEFLRNEIEMRRAHPILERQLKQHRSSVDILHAAARGDQESRNALVVDTRTHVGEVFGGVGQVSEVEMDVDESGATMWGGQTNEERQYHALVNQTGFTEATIGTAYAEGLVSFRLDDRNRDGQLEGKKMLTMSAAAEATRDELLQRGYFLNSIAVSFQEAKFEGNKCKITSIFVAGVDQRKLKPVPNETAEQEELRQEKALTMRFDIRILQKMYTLLGVEGASKMNPAELLSTSLVSDTFDIIDMVMLYDQLAAEEMEDGVKTFFGSAELWKEIGAPEKLTREHYEKHRAEREERQKRDNALCEAIVDEQIRRSAEATTPREAVELKRRVVLDMTVQRAVEDITVDASRFGRVAEFNINAARWQFANGDSSGGNNYTKEAQASAEDPSCPPGKKKNGQGAAGDNESKGSSTEQDGACKEIKNGARVHCPYCDRMVTARVPKEGGQIFCSNEKCEAYLPTKDEVAQAA